MNISKSQKQTVLGIETSCDETGVAVFHSSRGILSHALFSQINLHAEYGGVVPELASRDHANRLTPLIDQAMRQADVEPQDIDTIAYTAGPGLIGALLVGAATAHGLASAWGKPIVGVHHMEGHLLAPLLEDDAPEFPFIALLVSGGHTQLIAVESIGKYTLLGDTLDDAVGEAFDKTAQMLDLGYPGGPALSKLAEKGDAEYIRFPRPMLDRPGMDFSFSGLKTAVATALRKHPETEPAHFAASFEAAVVETLVKKCQRALTHCNYTRIVVAGGVGANQRLRQQLLRDGKVNGYNVYFPRQEFCTDNGAMIAHVGALRSSDAQTTQTNIFARPRWPLTDLSKPNE